MTQTFKEKLDEYLLNFEYGINCKPLPGEPPRVIFPLRPMWSREEAVKSIVKAVESLIPEEILLAGRDPWKEGFNDCRQEILDRLKE